MNAASDYNAQDGTAKCLGHAEVTVESHDGHLQHTKGAIRASDNACPPQEGLVHLGDKWTTQVLWELATTADGRVRFARLRRKIDGISSRMLTVTLRFLERNGLVIRQVFAEVPPRVEYELSPLGFGLVDALTPAVQWLDDHAQAMAQARERYQNCPSLRTPPGSRGRR